MPAPTSTTKPASGSGTKAAVKSKAAPKPATPAAVKKPAVKKAPTATLTLSSKNYSSW